MPRYELSNIGEYAYYCDIKSLMASCCLLLIHNVYSANIRHFFEISKPDFKINFKVSCEVARSYSFSLSGSSS